MFVNLTRDRVETFGVTFLGLTTGCAACHDHKFDPTSQKDSYQLAAFLNNTADGPMDFNSPILLRSSACPRRRSGDLRAAAGERGELLAQPGGSATQARKLMRARAGGRTRAATGLHDRLELRLAF